MGLTVVYDHNKDLVVVCDILLELFQIPLGHPSAQDIVVFLIVLHPCGHLADIKVIGQLFQTLFRCHKLGCPRGKQLRGFLFQLFDLVHIFADLTLQLVVGISRSSLKVIRQRDPFKVQGTENGIGLLRVPGRDEVGAVYIAFVPFPFHEDGLQVFHQILLHLIIVFYRDLSEAVGNILVVQHLAQITVQRPERSDDQLAVMKLFDLLF